MFAHEYRKYRSLSRMGEAVTARELAVLGSRKSVVAELRRRTLSLKGPAAPDPDEVFRSPAHIDFN